MSAFALLPRRSTTVLLASSLVLALPALTQLAAAATSTSTAATGVSAWGSNGSGRLGDGTTTTRRTAVAAKGLVAPSALAAGDAHSLAVDGAGAVWAWGLNSSGQLGDNSLTLRKEPKLVAGAGPAVGLAAGATFSLAVRSDGTVAAWGRNTSGQLGDGTITARKTPVTLSGLPRVTEVAAGDTHALALAADGTVWAWGANSYGQLGDGTTTAHRLPARVPGLSDVLGVAAGIGHSVALRADGTVWAWGHNINGQLGDGTTTLRKTPTQVAGLTEATAVSAGDAFTLALRKDGTVRSWGRNSSGQLGDGTTTTRKTPVTVSGLTGVTALAAGDTHALAALANGAVRAWGANGLGQLGDGTVTTRRTPVPVKKVADAGVLAAGSLHSLATSPPPLTGPEPAGWWTGDGLGPSAGADAAGDNPVVLSDEVATVDGQAACGFGLPPGASLAAPDALELEPGTSFSMSTWVSPTSVTGRRVVAAKATATTTAWSLAVVDGRLQLTTSSNGTTHRVTTTVDPVVVADRWQHVAVVFDGAPIETLRVQLYVDGAPVATAPFVALAGPPASIASLAAPTRFGGAGWDGGLDEVRLYDDPLTAADVAEAVAADLERADEACDLVAPVTRATLSEPANEAGWHRGPVDVELQSDDGEDGSGVASLTWSAAEAAEELVEDDGVLVPVSAEGVTTIRASATDLVGNVEPAQEFVVRVDRTPPLLAGTRSDAGATGWSTRPVTVTWTCSDAHSGVATCPAPTTTSGDGADQAVTATAVDAAGNSTTSTVGGIDVDATPPVLTGAPQDAADWYRDDVTVHWSATDAVSGVDPAAVPAPSTVTGEGAAVTVTASVSDLAGNVTEAQSAPMAIDRTGPVTAVTAPEGWSSSSAVVVLSPHDALSGVDSTWWSLDGSELREGTRAVVDEDGTHVLRWFSVDVAGNVEPTREVVVRVDGAAPVITHALSSPANEAGWHSAPVTVSFSCADSTSAVQRCSEDVVVDAEAEGQEVTGEALDAAGNRATTSLVVNLDGTAPVVEAAPVRPPGSNGWYDAPVDVAFTCTDALSGVASCPAAVSVGEGADQSAEGQATDAAGNVSSAAVEGLQVDVTAPELAGAVPASALMGWARSGVTVRWTCTDALSGLDGTCPGDTVLSGEGELSASATVRDLAGNETTTTVEGVRVDATAPVTTAVVPEPVADGWHAGSVTVVLEARDALSGTAGTTWALDGADPVPYDGPVSVAGDGLHELRFWSTDAAGNVEAEQRLVLRLDGTAPVLTLSGPAEGAQLVLGGPVPTVGCQVLDTRSGVAGTCTVTTTAPAGPVGTWTATATAADAAGNVATATRTWSVVYGWGGWAAPLTAPGRTDGLGRVTAKAGSTLPVAFTLTDAAGQPVLPSTAPEWLAPQPVGTPAADLAQAGTPMALQGGKHRHLWQTDRAQAGTTWLVRVRLADGTVRSLEVELR